MTACAGYRVGYQGAPGCNSHTAVNDFVDLSRGESIGFDTFEACFEALLAGEIDTAVIPVENTLGGQVSNALDSFVRSGLGGVDILDQRNFRFEALEEIWKPIRHALVVHDSVENTDEITAIYTHPQAAAQCAGTLRKLFKSVPVLDGGDTAGSVPVILERFRSSGEVAAAIAPPGAVTVYPGSKILLPELRDDPNNFTRFIHFRLRGTLSVPPPSRCSLILHEMPQKTLLMIVKCGLGTTQPGYLSNVLHRISSLGINLERVESRPLPASVKSSVTAGAPRYIFHVDVNCGPFWKSDLYEKLEKMPEFADMIVLGHPRALPHIEDLDTQALSTEAPAHHPDIRGYVALKHKLRKDIDFSHLQDQCDEMDELLSKYWALRHHLESVMEERSSNRTAQYTLSNSDTSSPQSSGSDQALGSSLPHKVTIGFIGLGPFTWFLIRHFARARKARTVPHTVTECGEATSVQWMAKIANDLKHVALPELRLVATNRSAGLDTSQSAHLAAFYPQMDIESMLLEEKVDVIFIGTAIIHFPEVVLRIKRALTKVYGDSSDPDIQKPLFIDVCSVKSLPAQAMKMAGIPYLSTHPMFGPDSGRDSWKGLKMVFCETSLPLSERQKAAATLVLKIFARRGCELVFCSPHEHDRWAACSQFATHFLGRAISAAALKRTPIDTKGFQSLMAVSENVCNDSSQLFHGLYRSNAEECDNFLSLLGKAIECVKEECSLDT